MSFGKDHKFADNAAFSVNVVIADVAPKPLPTPTPDRPIITEQLLPVYDGTQSTPVGNIFTDMGAHITQCTLAINFDHMVDSKVNALWEKWWAGEVVYYTDGVTVYQLQWASQGFRPERPEGVANWYRVQMNFHILDKTP